MKPTKFKNIFSENEIHEINSIVKMIEDPINDDGSYIYEEIGVNNTSTISKDLGRIQSAFLNGKLSDNVLDCVRDIAEGLSHSALHLSNITYVEYNNKYGTPNLFPHFDADSSDLIINFQLSSNTNWPLGAGFDIYDMQDNEALALNGNEHIHWRPHKIFKDNEYVRMIFFRFADQENVKDNRHLAYSRDHEILKDVNIFRDSLEIL